ncbi:MAG: M43 family zinc metalloprotease [Vicingaceae bacterium]|nr:M43 family zinc metalloprotease [Vicingaceae bacterium]
MKTTRLLLLVLISYLFQTVDVKAQHEGHFNCSSDEHRLELINKYPDILQKEQELEKFTQEFIKNNKNNKSNQTYVIPVVFHILHEYGSENISDAQVFDAIRVLNEDFSKSNADTSLVIPDFDTIIGKTNIEFRLAQIDAFGNCTNGIDRIHSHLTNNADNESKLNIWDRTKYLNIWVVKSIGDTPGVAGYAQFPSSVDNQFGVFIDGIVVLSTYVGAIGTSNAFRSRTLTHEVGHWLNLAHPWGLNNDAGTVCGDDGVHDTPETRGFTFCPTPAQAQVCNPGIVENYQNYMDYSFCNRMFTVGQVDRMHAALNSSVSGRNNLWSQANLVATGTDVPNPVNNCAPIADFTVNQRLICQGDAVTFTDASWKTAINSVNWTFSNGTPSTSTSSSQTVVFNDLFWQGASITATGNAGSDTETKPFYIYVSPPWSEYSGTYSESFENPTSYQSWFTITNENNASKWQATSVAGATGTSSMYLNAHSEPVFFPNYIPGIGRNDIDALISPSFDLSSVTSGVLTFKYSSATRATVLGEITEELKVYASLNCGKSWLPLRTIQGINLANAGSYANPYFPTQSSQWETVTINLQSALQTNNVRFKFEYKSGKMSNNLFLDDVNISGIVGIEENSTDIFNLNTYPNPFNESTTVSYTLNKSQNVTMRIYDLLGNVVLDVLNDNQTQGNHLLVINRGSLKSGIYLLKLTGDNGMEVNQKIVLQ